MDSDFDVVKYMSTAKTVLTVPISPQVPPMNIQYILCLDGPNKPKQSLVLDKYKQWVHGVTKTVYIYMKDEGKKVVKRLNSFYCESTRDQGTYQRMAASENQHVVRVDKGVSEMKTTGFTRRTYKFKSLLLVQYFGFKMDANTANINSVSVNNSYNGYNSRDNHKNGGNNSKIDTGVPEQLVVTYVSAAEQILNEDFYPNKIHRSINKIVTEYPYFETADCAWVYLPLLHHAIQVREW